MTPKEKAIELVLIYSKINTRYKDSIKCALIAVDEIIKNIKPIEIKLLISSFKTEKDFNDNFEIANNTVVKNLIKEKIYWQEVKKEIEKL